MTAIGTSLISGLPVEYVIPKSAEVVFVCDFFAKEVQGGAELTTEALIKKSPKKVFKLHSNSLTIKMLENNKDKFFVFGNFTQVKENVLKFLPNSGIKYSIIEYDFKFCVFRSINKHFQAKGTPCTCGQENHGLMIEKFFEKAKNIFWMSEGQKELWQKNLPDLKMSSSHDIILSSVFEEHTISLLSSLRNLNIQRDPRWAVLGSGSWIKGIEETQAWCKLNRKEFQAIPGMPYNQFLAALNAFQGLVFRPLDSDTCPRVTIEAKLLGMNLILGDNVLQKNDSWFKGSVEECEAYLIRRPEKFWNEILQDL